MRGGLGFADFCLLLYSSCRRVINWLWLFEQCVRDCQYVEPALVYIDGFRKPSWFVLVYLLVTLFQSDTIADYIPDVSFVMPRNHRSTKRFLARLNRPWLPAQLVWPWNNNNKRQKRVQQQQETRHRMRVLLLVLLNLDLKPKRKRYGKRLKTKRFITGTAPSCLAWKFAYRQNLSGNSLKEASLPEEKHDRLERQTHVQRETSWFDTCVLLASTHDIRYFAACSFCGIRHCSVHGIVASSRAQIIPQYVAKYIWK